MKTFLNWLYFRWFCIRYDYCPKHRKPFNIWLNICCDCQGERNEKTRIKLAKRTVRAGLCAALAETSTETKAGRQRP